MPIDMICEECNKHIWFYETMVTEWDVFEMKYSVYHYKCYNK